MANSLVTHTQIFSVANVAVTEGQVRRAPASGGQSVPTNLSYRSFEVLINLPAAIKEAVGNTLEFGVFLAANDQFVAGFLEPNPWTSYGQQLTVTLPDGSVVVDPDPGVTININTIAGLQIYATAKPNWTGLIGVTVNGLK